MTTIATIRLRYRIVAWECSRCDRLTYHTCLFCDAWMCFYCAQYHVCEKEA